MNIKKNPHFSEAKKLDLLLPKQFCELTGLPPNYATHLKKYAVYSSDNKRIKVRLTIDNIIISNAFKKIDWQSIKSNFESKKSKNPKSEKTTTKKKAQKSKNEIAPTVDTPEDSSEFSIPFYWRSVLNNILDFSEQDQNVNTKMLKALKDNLDEKLNPQNIKYITEAYQKFQSIQKDKQELIHKDIVVFMVGTICEFMLMSCNSLIKKQLKEYNAPSDHILKLENEFSNLIAFAQKEIKQLIGEKIDENRD